MLGRHCDVHVGRQGSEPALCLEGTNVALSIVQYNEQHSSRETEYTDQKNEEKNYQGPPVVQSSSFTS